MVDTVLGLVSSFKSELTGSAGMRCKVVLMFVLFKDSDLALIELY